MSDRATILAAIRRSLTQSRSTLEHLASSASHIPPPFVHPPESDLVNQFVTELERLEGNVYRRIDNEAARETLQEILTKEGAETFIAWDEADIGVPDLNRMIESIGVRRVDADAAGGADPRQAAVQALAAAPVGITGADAAIAESGTLVLAGGKGRGRLASLLAPIHIAIVRETQIVRGLGEALERLKSLYGDRILTDRSNLTFITGPSRTADIELTLTLGVHGPREVHVIIVERGS